MHSDGFQTIGVETTAVVVLAKGATTAEVSANKGHLLEDLLAQLLGELGYEKPTVESLRVTAEGIELDVTAKAKVTGQQLIAECKAYSSNISAGEFTSFMGKYLLAREDNRQLAGIFLGLPRLTAGGKEQADRLAEKASLFRYLSSAGVCRLLQEAALLPAVSEGPKLGSDITVVITRHGLALAAHELDSKSRRAKALVLWTRTGSVPEPLRMLVESSSLANGLPVVIAGDAAEKVPAKSDADPSIVSVRESTSDFEYQLPAAPRFFIGRKEVATGLAESIRTRVNCETLVVNAKSGWGKSSLALRLKNSVDQAGGVGLVVDTRTAETSRFVTAALEKFTRQLSDRGIITLREDAAFGSVASSLKTLAEAQWSRRPPLLLFFDQFENVFRDDAVTREFRDLAVQASGMDVPLTIGFAWKTDLVGWTEDHPYRLRDEIREMATRVILEPLGPREIETLLRRLEKALSEKLDVDLRRRLREYSQGLPWLFRKLASHILGEVSRGATQEQLVRQSLNVQALFESDLAELSPKEQEGLRAIARSAPALVSDLEEVVPNAIVQSLLNRRLIVQVGDRIDTYWDIFRDFLLTGSVAIQDSYIIRYGPASVGRLMRRLLAHGGEMSVADAAEELATSSNAVFNLARELRLMGLVRMESSQIIVVSDIAEATDQESACKAVVAAALRRHKISTVVLKRLSSDDIRLSFADVAAELPRAFPTVESMTRAGSLTHVPFASGLRTGTWSGSTFGDR